MIAIVVSATVMGAVRFALARLGVAGISAQRKGTNVEVGLDTWIDNRVGSRPAWLLFRRQYYVSIPTKIIAILPAVPIALWALRAVGGRSGRENPEPALGRWARASRRLGRAADWTRTEAGQAVRRFSRRMIRGAERVLGII